MYGIQPLDDYTSPGTTTWKLWFKRLFDFVTSQIKLVTVTASYTIVADVFYVRADGTGGVLTVTLPAALTSSGRQIAVKKIDASANAITIAAAGSDTIDGAATMSLASQWDKQVLISNGDDGWEKL